MKFKKRILLLLILIACVSFKGEAQVITDLRLLMMQEDYKSAHNLSKKMLASRATRSDTSEIEYYLALSQFRLGEYKKAEQSFRKIINSRPIDSLYDRAVIGLADSFFAQSYYEKSIKELDSLVHRRGTSLLVPLAYLKSARAHLKLAHWRKAKELLEKIIVDYPKSFESQHAKQMMMERQYFTVQVGAFVDKGRAENLVRELKERQEYAYIVEVKVSSQQTTYRVRVGQLSSLKEAQALESKLTELGYTTIIYP